MKCPSCGTDGEGGRFCANCGTALGKAECSTCGHELPGAAQFCSQCGTAIGLAAPPTRPSGNRLAWWTAGALLLGLVMVIAYPVYGPERAATPPQSGPGPAAGLVGAPTDLSTMTSREAADALFNRVMRAVSANNSTEVLNFLPMAIAAHELVENLDTDGKFHLVLLRLTGQFSAEALEGAEEILSEQPSHLLGLAMAGDASLALGDSASAREYYRRWLDAHETEKAKGLLEYDDHSGMFPEMEARAEALGRND